MSATVHFYVLGGGLTITAGTLVRTSYMIGGLINELRAHIKDSQQVHSDQELRLRMLERRRR
jgi:hypothetical protein